MAQRTMHINSAAAVDWHPYMPVPPSTAWRSDMIPCYRKKPGEIKAVRWNGTNRDEVHALFGELPPDTQGRLLFASDGTIVVPTRDGDRIASLWDWLVRDADGSVSPVTHETFVAAYEPITVTVHLINI
jgi:hypothetical protein